MSIQDALAKVEIFSEMEKEDLDRLAKVTVTREFKKGDIILKEGDAGVAFYVLTKGHVEVVTGLGSSHEQVVATLGPDSFFGEMALFDNHLRSASVRATSDCECLVLTKWDFNAELTTSGDIAVAMLKVLARRIREQNAATPTF